MAFHTVHSRRRAALLFAAAVLLASLPLVPDAAPPLSVPRGAAGATGGAGGGGPGGGAVALLPARGPAVAAAGAAGGASPGGAEGAGGFRGPALLSAWRDRSAGGAARGGVQPAAAAGGVRGVDDHHAGGADGRSGAAELAVQIARELPGAPARAALRQGPHPRDVSESHTVRRQRRGGGGGGVVLLRKGPGPALARRDRPAHRPSPLAAALRSDHPSQGGPRRPRPGARPARLARGVLAARARCRPARASPAGPPPAAVRGSALHRNGGGAVFIRRRNLGAHPHHPRPRHPGDRRGAGGAAHPRAARPGDRQRRRGGDRQRDPRRAGDGRLGGVPRELLPRPGERRDRPPLPRLDPQAVPLRDGDRSGSAGAGLLHPRHPHRLRRLRG